MLGLHGHSMRRFFCVAAGFLALLIVAGCSTSLQSFVPPVDTPLQDPPPGRAVVYLMRAPHDSSSIAVFVEGTKLAALAPGTYTAIALFPGKHVLTTRSTSLFSANIEVAPPYELHVGSDERRFLNISGVTAQSLAVGGFLPLSGGVVIPLLMPQQGTASGTLAWKEVRELDAQGLMSISKSVLPEKGAL